MRIINEYKKIEPVHTLIPYKVSERRKRGVANLNTGDINLGLKYSMRYRFTLVMRLG